MRRRCTDCWIVTKSRLSDTLSSIAVTIATLFARVVAALLPPWFLTNGRFFRIWEERGYHITPVHFYQPIPDTRTLAGTLWTARSALVGIDMNEQQQIDLLIKFSTHFEGEVEALPMTKTATPHQYYIANDAFGGMDGAILYSMVRHWKPQRIIEIGSGYSTYLLAQALRRNEEVGGQRCRLTVIDPHPNDVVRAGFPGLSRLMESKIQDVPLSEFTSLEENDILFIDSSHVLSIGSDVQYEYLEVLPRLNRGVLVHSHDIFLPVEYPREWVLGRHRFWNEQHVVQAFLAFNHSFQVLWAGVHMNLSHSGQLKSAFGTAVYGICGGGASFWMRRV